jgi:excisionase family DNA binding protein
MLDSDAKRSQATKYEGVTAMSDEDLMTVAEVATRVRITEYTVRHWLQTGRLKGYRPGGNRAGWRIRKSDFDQFLEASVNNQAQQLKRDEEDDG